MNYVHERALTVVYDNHSSSYPQLIIKNEPTIHQHNIKILIKEIFKKTIEKRKISICSFNR